MAESQKLEKQLCNCYSLEYAHVSKYEVSPFTALLNLLKSKYHATPEIFRTTLAVLLEYTPNSVDSRKTTIRCLRVLLEKNQDLADSLISMLPEQPGIQESYTNPLTAKPTKVKPEQWKGTLGEEKQKLGPKYYNCSSPAITAFIASQGIPSKVTSNDVQLIQPACVEPDNRLLAVHTANSSSKDQIFSCGLLSFSSNREIPKVSRNQNVVPLIPTKQPRVWSSSPAQGLVVNTQLPPASLKENKGLESTVTRQTKAVPTCVSPSEPNGDQEMRAKRKLMESLELDPGSKRQCPGSGDTYRISNETGSEVMHQEVVGSMKSQHFPYTQTIAFKYSTSGNDVLMEHDGENSLACLAQMVEQLPPLPVDDDTGNVPERLSKSPATKVQKEVKTTSETVSRGQAELLTGSTHEGEVIHTEVPEIGSSNEMEKSTTFTKDKISELANTNGGIRSQVSSREGGGLYEGVGSPCPVAEIRGSSPPEVQSRESYDWLVLETVEEEVRESSQEGSGGSQGSTILVVDIS